MVYQVKSNRMLDPFLGMKWDERILNPAGDFAYVISGTIKYWLGQRNPITKYKIIGEQYMKSEIENSHVITFQFVRASLPLNSLMSRSIKTSEILRKRCNVSIIT
ncbi:unnamed protein product [Porites evermanni]|uniref:Uncharacterized protein n=1 Tax=Porites evermanni TaxID=104178 RepID=A0ABN8NDV9_9CNID|nr:unnamed protein product [Porites evermanni]